MELLGHSDSGGGADTWGFRDRRGKPRRQQPAAAGPLRCGEGALEGLRAARGRGGGGAGLPGPPPSGRHLPGRPGQLPRECCCRLGLLHTRPRWAHTECRGLFSWLQSSHDQCQWRKHLKMSVYGVGGGRELQERGHTYSYG